VEQKSTSEDGLTNQRNYSLYYGIGMDDGIRKFNIEFRAGMAVCSWWWQRVGDTRTLIFFNFSCNNSVALLYTLQQMPFKFL